MQVFDVFIGTQELEPLKLLYEGKIIDQLYTTTIEDYLYSHPKEWNVSPGRYNIVRCIIGSEGRMFGVSSLRLITATVTQPISIKDFFECTQDPSCKKLALSIDYSDPQILTQNQRRQVVDQLSRFANAWWINAVAEVKKLLSKEVTKEDEAIDIYHAGRAAYYDEKNLLKAKGMFNKAISHFHEVGGARHDLGIIAIDEGDLKTAIRMFEDELRYAKKPSRDTSLLYLYSIYTVIGDVHNASLISKKVEEIENRIFLSSDAINKIRIAARNQMKI